MPTWIPKLVHADPDGPKVPGDLWSPDLFWSNSPTLPVYPYPTPGDFWDNIHSAYNDPSPFTGQPWFTSFPQNERVVRYPTGPASMVEYNVSFKLSLDYCYNNSGVLVTTGLLYANPAGDYTISYVYPPTLNITGSAPDGSLVNIQYNPAVSEYHQPGAPGNEYISTVISLPPGEYCVYFAAGGHGPTGPTWCCALFAYQLITVVNDCSVTMSVTATEGEAN